MVLIPMQELEYVYLNTCDGFALVQQVLFPLPRTLSYLTVFTLLILKKKILLKCFNSLRYN